MQNPRRPKILCVDDEASVLAALTRLLGRDFEVVVATSGAEAIQLLGSHRDVAIVLTDHRMPGLTGLDLLNHVQALAPEAVRVLLSAHIDVSEMVEAVNTLRIHRLVLKPWDNDYLRLQMLEALANHSLLREKRELEQLAITDAVTHLRNHRFFQDQLRIEVDRSLRHQRPLSLIMVDIDNFKTFNDQFGHPAGDALLKAVAGQLQAGVRSLDTVARYGGEEFALLLPETSFENAMDLAERLRLIVERSSQVAPDGRPTFVTISLGVASCPQHSTSAPSLLRIADTALYQAKRRGRNQSVGA